MKPSSGRPVHMNGRGYDPNLGRFLSVDPIIQAPANSQSFNPYSYIMNNPLAGTDPTGYCSAEAGSHIRTCDVKVTQTFSDGSQKTRSFNSRSAGDMAKAASTVIRAVGQMMNGGNGASGGLSSIGTNRSDGGGGAPQASAIGQFETPMEKVEISGTIAAKADQVPEGAAAAAIARRVFDDFTSDPSKPVDIDWPDFMTVADFDATRPARDGVPGMPFDAFVEHARADGGDSSFSRSALGGAFYNLRGGPPRLSGIHQGSDVNYYHQGFLWAAKGLPKAIMYSAIGVHNTGDVLGTRSSAEKSRNLGQMWRASIWADWGYDYYQERSR